MKLADIRIGTQLRLGFGLILALVGVLGFVSWREADQLWLHTKTIIEHPLAVRTAVGALEADIAEMSLAVRDVRLARKANEVAAALGHLERDRSDATRQLAILDERYLGPRSDVESLRDEMAKWNALRDTTIRLLREGKTEEGTSRLLPGGVQAQQSLVVKARLATIASFANAKSAEIERKATASRDALNRTLALVFGLVAFLMVAVSWILLRGITRPLAHLTSTAESFRKGNLDARCGNSSSNELGTLAAAFNALADKVQKELVFGEHGALLSSAMIRDLELGSFGRRVLQELMDLTGSQVGAVYVLNDARTDYEHLQSIGLGTGVRSSFSATLSEGELGATLATGQIKRIKDIPDDTRFTFCAVSGEMKPREVITIPLHAGTQIPAMISLASVREYGPDALRLVDELQGGLAVWMNAMLASRRVHALTEDLANQNHELEGQAKELAAQSDELTRQNAELQQQKRKLDEANRLKTAFLSNMSHELRTPLNSVIALSGVLGRRLAAKIPAEEQSYLEVIERNGKNLLELINDILDLSRIEAGREELSIAPFSIHALTNEVVDTLDRQAKDKEIALVNKIPADLPALASDEHKCRHILQNLLANAVKFTDEGRVTVGANVVDDMLELEVSDTGIGIDASQQAIVFDEFRQADDSTSRKYGGTGLGLAIARRYARLLGGDIRVSSIQGKGSTFTVTLPLASGAPDSARAPASHRSRNQATPPATGQQLLLVEDSEPAIVQITDVLRAEGYQVDVAHDGKEALEALPRVQPVAAILDLMMPGVDGFELLRVMREQPRWAGLPVLILTAKHVTKQELAFLSQNGVHQLIQKGDIDEAGLLSAVAAMVTPHTEETPAHKPRRRREAAATDKPVVLVVEDNEDNLETARAVLAGRFHVIEARDGLQGLEQARRHLPDVVLMDIALPILDGIQALEEMRRDETLRDIPVIAVTASAMKGDRESIMAHGFDGYVSKPIDHELMMAALREVLDE